MVMTRRRGDDDPNPEVSSAFAALPVTVEEWRPSAAIVPTLWPRAKSGDRATAGCGDICHRAFPD